MGWKCEFCGKENDPFKCQFGEEPAASAGYDLCPCPFCGGSAAFGVSEDRDNGEYVQCQKCFASTALVYPLMEDAKPILADKWNRRS